MFTSCFLSAASDVFTGLCRKWYSHDCDSSVNLNPRRRRWLTHSRRLLPWFSSASSKAGTASDFRTITNLRVIRSPRTDGCCDRFSQQEYGVEWLLDGSESHAFFTYCYEWGGARSATLAPFAPRLVQPLVMVHIRKSYFLSEEKRRSLPIRRRIGPYCLSHENQFEQKTL